MIFGGRCGERGGSERSLQQNVWLIGKMVKKKIERKKDKHFVRQTSDHKLPS